MAIAGDVSEPCVLSVGTQMKQQLAQCWFCSPVCFLCGKARVSTIAPVINAETLSSCGRVCVWENEQKED